MKRLRTNSNAFCHGAILAFWLAAVSLTRASIVWNGPTNGFFHAAGGMSDEITTNVIITRGGSLGLYNSFLESGAVAGVSPKGTAWAIGSLSNYSTLTYGSCPLEMGERPPNDVGKTYVVHLLTNNIYLQLTLTNWGGAGGSGNTTFGYTRSSPTVPPIITSPSSGAIFGVPANVTLQASVATNVPIAFTNLQFYANNVLLGSVSAPPFNFTANDLAAGSYSLTAVEIAGGIATTSAAVNITVGSPLTVTITNPVAGAVFSAPANLTIDAIATDSAGTVTGVEFLISAGAGSFVIGDVATSPYLVVTNDVGANNYTLTAVASDNEGFSSTNSISISVVTPVAVSLGSPTVVGPANFEFNYAANVGLSYVVQVSTNLTLGNWVSLVTNVAASNPVVFADAHATNNDGYYRVGLLPNP